MHLRLHFKRLFGIFALTAAITSYQSVADAARVLEVKDKKILIDLENTPLTAGQNYFVTSGTSRVGVIKVTRVAGRKALAELTKGRAAVGNGIQAPGGAAGGGAQAARQQAPRSGESARAGRVTRTQPSGTAIWAGGLVGYGMDSQAVNYTDAGGTKSSAAMSGSGFSVMGFADVPFTENFGVIGRAGYQQFAVTGKGFTTSINYLSADAILRASLPMGSFIPYGGAGLSILYPMSKESTILDPSKIALTSVLILTGGAHYLLSDTMMITASAEYGYFPPSADVATSWITVRGGAGFRF